MLKLINNTKDVVNLKLVFLVQRFAKFHYLASGLVVRRLLLLSQYDESKLHPCKSIIEIKAYVFL